MAEEELWENHQGGRMKVATELKTKGTRDKKQNSDKEDLWWWDSSKTAWMKTQEEMEL